MVLSAKSKSSGGGGDGWGTGFLLIFFPEDENFSKKKTLFSLSSSSSPCSPFSTRSSSAAAAAPLISKTRSTLSICGLLVFTTLLLFTLSTFEPTTPLRPSSRRLLLTNHHPRKQSLTMQSPHSSFTKITNLFHPSSSSHSATDIIKRNKALQGMGTLYRRGTKSVSDLIVGHVKEDASEVELRGFIRMLHHNGLLSRSDLVLIYHSPSAAAKLSLVVEEENESFLKLVCLYREMKNSTSRDPVSARYLKIGKEQDNTNKHGGNEKKKKEEKESVWGKGSQKTINSTEHSDKLTQINYGSLVGFDASELDLENSLSGFLDHVPLNLRRWAVYPMLLGRVRRNYKHMMLVDIKDVIVLHDPLTRIRNLAQESLFLWTTESSSSSKHDKKRNSGGKSSHHRDSHQKPVVFSSSVMVGGSRGVRRFANAVLNEIVRTTIEHKGRNKNSVSESGLVNQLVRNGYVLKNVNLVEPGESIRDVSSIDGLNSLDSASFLLSSGNNGNESRIRVVGRGHSSSDVDSVIRRVICSSSELCSSVYKDCVVDQ